MSLLRILRNLAVLVILTVGVLASTPRRAAANQCAKGGAPCNHKPCCVGFTCSGGICRQPLCTQAGQVCDIRTPPCCPGLYCVLLGNNTYCESP
jgi:hypothetical protein